MYNKNFIVSTDEIYCYSYLIQIQSEIQIIFSFLMKLLNLYYLNNYIYLIIKSFIYYY